MGKVADAGPKGSRVCLCSPGKSARAAWAALWLGLFLRGPAAAGGLSGDAQLTAIKSEIEATIQDLEPKVRALDEFKAKYPVADDLSQLEVPRSQSRREVETALDRLRDQMQEFRTIRKEDQFKRGTLIISKFLSGEEGTKVEEDLKAVLDLGDYPDQVQRVINSAKDALAEDQQAYQRETGLRKAAKRKRMMFLFGAAGICALGAFVLFLVRLRREMRPKTVTGIPVGLLQGQNAAMAQGALYGPADTPMPGLGMNTPRPALAGPHSPPPAETVAPGDLLGGNFKIVKELGKGSLGPVYEARETSAGKRAVIKRIREELHRTDKDLERFLAQARVTASLKHANVAEVYSVFLEEERVHLAVEFVEGAALSRFLDTGNRITMKSIKRVLFQVAGALDHAHAGRIIHGDLKPSNVMITQDGTVKVLDFGIGLEARKTAAKLSWSEALGSPAYMAPEQELGTTFKESDFFSLGVLLYEMLTGKLPFEGPNFLAQKREMRFHPPSRIVPDTPKEADEVVRKALQAEPQFRFRKGADFAAALGAVPDGAGAAKAAKPPGA